MITSPPYNVEKEYDKNLTMKAYLRLISDALKETYRVLIPDGRVWFNVANIGRKPYIPIHKHVIDIALRQGFVMRGKLYGTKRQGQVYPLHEVVGCLHQTLHSEMCMSISFFSKGPFGSSSPSPR